MMLYRSVIDSYAAIRQASSREWQISGSLVMCVELDMSMDGYLEVPAHSSRNQKGSQFLRIAYFRRNDDATGGWIPMSDVALASPAEREFIEDYRRSVERWIQGQADLSPSTSRAIADRLRRKR